MTWAGLTLILMRFRLVTMRSSLISSQTRELMVDGKGALREVDFKEVILPMGKGRFLGYFKFSKLWIDPPKA
jgi:hypothetical protein